MRHLKLVSAVFAAALVWPGVATAAETGKSPTGPANIQVKQSDEYGAYLTDAEGRTIYMFMADTQAQGDAKATTACMDDCAEAWPPVLTQGDPEAGDEIDETKLGTIERPDGATQVTYNGWPLYYFAKDMEAGQINGQDVKGFGAEWYILGPDGEKITKAAE